MDRPGGIPSGVVSEVVNLHSQRLYAISTAPEIGQDYWTTAVAPMIQKTALFGLIKRNVPDFRHQLFAFIRNSKNEAHAVHAQVRHIVSSEKEEDWMELIPDPAPPDGYSVGAKKKLRSVLGD